MLFKYLGRLFLEFINSFKKTPKNQPKKIDRGTESIKVVSAKKTTKKGKTFADALLEALEYVRPQMCVSRKCFDYKAFKENEPQRNPVYISRITYVCGNCGHYYPVVNNKALRLIKYMKIAG